MLTRLSVLALVALPFLPCARETEDPFVRLELENGIRVAILHVAEAKRQSFLSFLPVGLYHDEPGRAQFTHLIEHMLIRSTDPDSLSLDGLSMNGETMGGTLRLDAYATPEKWRTALDRQARWLAASEFDEEVLAREKGRIAGELESTVPGGHTHKWASAAWSQIIGGKLEHAAVHADVQNATVEQVVAYVKEYVHGGRGALLVAVGPVDAREVAKAIEESFGELDMGRGKKAAPRGPKSLAAGDVEATWDLDAHHYLEWYPVPADTPARTAAAKVIATGIQQALFLSGDARLGQGKALAVADLVTSAGRAITISVALDAGADVAEVRQAIRTVLDGLPTGPSLGMALFQMAMQSGRLDLEAYYRQVPSDSPARDLLETQVALNLVNEELQTGLSSPALVEALRELDKTKVKALAKEILAAKNRSSLRLAPAD